MNEQVTAALNRLWTVERALIDQYVARAKLCEAWGEHEHANRFRAFAFTEMRDVSAMLDRVIAIGGSPELDTVGAVVTGGSLGEQLQLSLEFERRTIAAIEETIHVCRDAGDDETRALLEAGLEEQREHERWLAEEVARARVGS